MSHRAEHDSIPMEETKKALYECWKYDLGCHAYFSCGAARGAEIAHVPDFQHCQFLFNSLRFQLRSMKNQTHGRNFNEKVEHWLPPSASRRSIICHTILYPALELAGLQLPHQTLVGTALSEMFAKTMNLPKPLSTKINRDFIAVLTDYIAPLSLSKTSTTQQMASHFHHSQDIHNNYYSAEIFHRDKEGNMIPGPLSIANQIWSALGENMTSIHSSALRPVLDNIILTKENYDYAAKRAYQDQSAKVTELQYAAINHASSREITKHAFVTMGCGTGKSGIYNLLLLGAYLHMAVIPKIMVISPHNSLLSQHKQQSCHYLRGTNLQVSSLLPVDIRNDNFPSHFDIIFISIHAFNDLITDYMHVLLSWNVKNIFIDEYHNIVGELFRFSSSWQSLRLIASLNVKIMFLSATTDKYLMQHLATFMSIGQFDIIGSTSDYPVPNVSINIVLTSETKERDTLLDTVVRHCQKLTTQKRDSPFKIHAITMSRKDAQELSDRLDKVGLQSMWLTSTVPPTRKLQLLKLWEDGKEQVMVSTFTDGIDNSITEDVIIVGATNSIYSLVQAIGRIRPKRQKFSKAAVHIFHSKCYVHFDNQEVEDTISRAIGAKIFPHHNREETKQYFVKMFHVNGYKKWIEQLSCYRKVLYQHFSINSPTCNHCTNCKQRNVINKSAITTSNLINMEEAQRKVVCHALHTMLTHCLICLSTECNGIECFPSKPSRCYCCHVAINRTNFHKSSNCPADTSSKKIDTKGLACPGCFVTFSNDIPQRGKVEDHINNKCPHKKRVKRVLLYQIENTKDAGVTARNLLVSTLSNPKHWISVMATNIHMINQRKS